MLTIILTGISLAAIYAIAASGLVVTYTTTGTFNFAHGAIGMLDTMAMTFVVRGQKVSYAGNAVQYQGGSEASLADGRSVTVRAVAKGNSGGPAMGGDEGSILPGEAHYLGSVTSLARIFAEPFTRERYNLDDFLDITYGTLFETEAKKTLQKLGTKPDGTPRRRPVPALAYSLPGGFGAGGSSDSTTCNRVDIFPSESGRARAKASLAAAEEEEQREVEREREERKRKLGVDGDDEDDDEREAREAIEQLKSAERAKKRKVDQTGTHDACAMLFSFA